MPKAHPTPAPSSASRTPARVHASTWSRSRVTLLGIISDTHSLLREEALAALGGCELIIHAGDVGSPMVLDRLREIAPVIAVRGNVDTAPWAQVLPETEVIRIASHNIYVLHDRSSLTLDPVDAGMAAVVFGHSHKLLAETHGGVLYLNPGSAGPQRFRLPITVARLHVAADRLKPEIVRLAARSPPF
jgi:uncharacterized protein